MHVILPIYHLIIFLCSSITQSLSEYSCFINLYLASCYFPFIVFISLSFHSPENSSRPSFLLNICWASVTCNRVSLSICGEAPLEHRIRGAALSLSSVEEGLLLSNFNSSGCLSVGLLSAAC